MQSREARMQIITSREPVVVFFLIVRGGMEQADIAALTNRGVNVTTDCD